MSIRIPVLLFLMLASTQAMAVATEAPASAVAPERAMTKSEVIIENANLTLEMARDGEFGRVRGNDMQDLEDARDTIASLLVKVADPNELGPDERVELFNAQTRITEIVRNDDKQRKICRRVSVTGSRVAATECLTVAQREQRRRAAREQTGNVQRGYCLAGTVNGGESVSACSK